MFRLFLPSTVCILGLLWSIPVIRAADDAAAAALPPNLGHSLRQLVAWHRAQPANLSASERQARLAKSLPARAARVQANADATRAVVDVTLDGSVPLGTVRQSLTKLSADVFAQYDAHRAGSVLSAHLPLDQAEAAARLPGVHSVNLVHRAWRRVGLVTSQGVEVLRTNKVNQSFDGTGITVGVISDSFSVGRDEANNPLRTTAYQDTLNGDLPGPFNPFGHLLAVRDLGDASTSDDYHDDEGRAMCQIIHDLAPGAQLAFHTAGTTPETLAAAIAIMRSYIPGDSDDYGNINCDVIVDDYGFPDEPMFSDGPVALKAKELATSLLLPGNPAVYVSSAGNEGDVAYGADFAPVSDADARAGQGAGNLQLAQVPAALTAGGFHNFDPRPGKVTLGQKAKLRADAEISFQWDDPFIPGAITTDYNLLVFDADGNYLPDLSGTDDNIGTGKALEVVDLTVGDAASVTYQFAITRTAGGTGAAKHLRYVMNGGNPTVKFMGYNQPTTFGHNAGPDVIGVAAYAYDKLGEPEAYSSVGPATIYFDAQGNRLATPEVRQQPAVAAVDGVDTSFFPPGPLTLDDGSPGTDSDGDGYPNFFGTSAASPHVAAVAALLLQAAGGPGSLTPAQVLSLLQSTAATHDLDPNFTAVTLAPGNGMNVTLSATADESDAASEDKNGFHLTFDGPAGEFLSKVVINLGATGLKFDPSADLGYPFTTGTKVGLRPTDVTATLDAADMTLTLSFVPGAFTAGRALNFGIDRDLVSTGTDGNSADLLAGATVKVRAKGAAGVGKAQGALASNIGLGYSPAVGFGLVDAAAAVKALQANPPVNTPPGLTSGDILLTSSYNQIAEIRPDGTQVQVFPTLPDPTNGTVDASYRKYNQSVVDANGNIAVLYDAFTMYLVTLNPRTGATTTATAPGWSSLGGGQALAAVGNYVFAAYTQQGIDSFGSPTPLLRFDAAGAVQPFGQAGYTYASLARGPDGMLYALGGKGLYETASVDVYDPETLAFVRNIVLNFAGTDSLASQVSKMTVGPAGEFYTLSSDPYDNRTIYKFDPTGQRLGLLALPDDTQSNDKNLNSASANAQGAVVVGALDPVLVDPTFTMATVLSAFGVNTYTYGPTITATFIP